MQIFRIGDEWVSGAMACLYLELALWIALDCYGGEVWQ